MLAEIFELVGEMGNGFTELSTCSKDVTGTESEGTVQCTIFNKTVECIVSIEGLGSFYPVCLPYSAVVVCNSLCVHLALLNVCGHG